MDTSLFVQNVKKYCELKGVAPTIACKESGAGKDLLPNVKKGQTPSVAKVQMLAQYLGVTTSDLLGEQNESSPPSEEDRLLDVFGDLTEDEKQDVARYVDLVKARRKQ